MNKSIISSILNSEERARKGGVEWVMQQTGGDNVDTVRTEARHLLSPSEDFS